jgi:gentisate 1,2-dioxygenase
MSPSFRPTPRSRTRTSSRRSSPSDGVRRVRYVNPANGGAATNLLDSSLIQIDAGATSLPFRTTAHAVVAVVEGTGTTTIGDTTFAWEPKDVFSLTADDWIVHHAVDGPARLFITSDREVLRRLDLLVEESGSA